MIESGIHTLQLLLVLILIEKPVHHNKDSETFNIPHNYGRLIDFLFYASLTNNITQLHGRYFYRGVFETRGYSVVL